MSRRSILLTTTFHIAIGWLAAAGPASAHGFGFGGLGGGQSSPSSASRPPAYGNVSRAPIQSMSNSMNIPGGTRFGHMPSTGGPAAGSNIVSSPIGPARIPAASNAPLTNTSTQALPQSVRPAQLSPTVTSSGIGVRQPVDAAGIATAPLQGRVNATGILSVPVTARYPVNQPGGTEPGLPSRIISAEGDGKLPKPGNTEGVPNVTGAPRIIGQAPSADHNMTSQGAALANARPAVDTLKPAYLMPTPADVAKAADEARQKRIADLRQKKKDLMALMKSIADQIAAIQILTAETDTACNAEIKALEQAVQKAGGNAGEAAGAVIGGVVGGPLGAAAGAVVGATIGVAASEVATLGLTACKQLADEEVQISDLLEKLAVTKAALADVDTAIAKALKEQAAEDERQRLLDAGIGSLTGTSRAQGATK